VACRQQTAETPTHVGLRMDCGYCGYPQQSTKFVDVDWALGGLDPRLVDCGLDWMDVTN
jgi:hypothetical protein